MLHWQQDRKQRFFNCDMSIVADAPHVNVQGTSYEITRIPVERSWALERQCKANVTPNPVDPSVVNMTAATSPFDSL